MRFSRLWPIVLLCLPALASASIIDLAVRPPSATISGREQRIFRPPVRDAHFADVPHTAARSRCEDTEPPQALATPNPLLVGSAEEAVTVSFIIGTDGKVHSPLILKGEDSQGNRLVLDAVRHWKYRPATCNGVPTEVEGKVQFSRR